MSIVDKIVTEWAFRCKKGYPDLENPDDMNVLKKIYSEYGFVMEANEPQEEEDELEFEPDESQEDDEIDFDSDEQPAEEPTSNTKSATIATPKSKGTTKAKVNLQ